MFGVCIPLPPSKISIRVVNYNPNPTLTSHGLLGNQIASVIVRLQVFVHCCLHLHVNLV